MLPRPARGWRKKTGPRDSSLIAIAIAISSGEKSDEQGQRADDVEDPLGGHRGRGQDRRADREQRQAADLVERADAVEELEEAGDDVDRDAGVAAGADRLEQLLVAGAGEGDDDAVDLLRLDDLVEVGEAAEPGQVGGADVVDVVVDDADRDEAELVVVAEASRRPGRRPRRSRGSGCAGADPGRGAGRRGRRRGRCAVKAAMPATVRKVSAIDLVKPERRGDSEQRPGDEQDGDEAARDLGDGRGPGGELVAAVEADAESGERPESDRAEDVGEARPGGRGRAIATATPAATKAASESPKKSILASTAPRWRARLVDLGVATVRCGCSATAARRWGWVAVELSIG